jgi:4'-phosphopantetheinyl transferase
VGDRLTAAHELEVWCIDIAGLACEEARLSLILDDEERERAGRFVRRADALGYRVAHAALRAILSGYVGIAPRQIRFASGEHGKPLLGDGGPHFNLSHSGGLALVAVSADGDVGVDVEQVRAIPRAPALAELFFSPEEARTIADQPPSCRDRQFMRSWTAMEAIAKAEGTGLGAGSAGDVRDGGVRSPLARASRRPRWSVRRLALPPTHVGAVAARSDDSVLRMRRFGDRRNAGRGRSR